MQLPSLWDIRLVQIHWTTKYKMINDDPRWFGSLWIFLNNTRNPEISLWMFRLKTGLLVSAMKSRKNSLVSREMSSLEVNPVYRWILWNQGQSLLSYIIKLSNQKLLEDKSYVVMLFLQKSHFFIAFSIRRFFYKKYIIKILW